MDPVWEISVGRLDTDAGQSSVPMDECAKGYPWPASQLTSAEMKKLSILRNETKRPITLLLRDAVDALWAVRLHEVKKQDDQSGQIGG